MHQVVLLGTVLIGVTGCAASTSAGKSERDERREAVTVVEAVPVSLSEVRASCAVEGAEAVDTFVVRPTRIELRIGQTFSLADLNITPVGARGAAPAPRYFDLDSPVAKLDGAVIRALSVGEAEFRILPFCR
jgi:hypothetical protein